MKALRKSTLKQLKQHAIDQKKQRTIRAGWGFGKPVKPGENNGGCNPNTQKCGSS